MESSIFAEVTYQAVSEAWAKAWQGGLPTYSLGVARCRAFRRFASDAMVLDGLYVESTDESPWFHVKHQ